MATFSDTPEAWTVEYDENGKFERFFKALGDYEQAVLVAAIEPDSCHLRAPG